MSREFEEVERRFAELYAKLKPEVKLEFELRVPVVKWLRLEARLV